MSGTLLIIMTRLLFNLFINKINGCGQGRIIYNYSGGGLKASIVKVTMMIIGKKIHEKKQSEMNEEMTP